MRHLYHCEKCGHRNGINVLIERMTEKAEDEIRRRREVIEKMKEFDRRLIDECFRVYPS